MTTLTNTATMATIRGTHGRAPGALPGSARGSAGAGGVDRAGAASADMCSSIAGRYPLWHEKRLIRMADWTIGRRYENRDESADVNTLGHSA